ncbi:MAG: hypothetical protein M3083_03120 [Actinomycetota bacterium]|nr:hypothetical protein [Actinomycetota bacterium]
MTTQCERKQHETHHQTGIGRGAIVLAASGAAAVFSATSAGAHVPAVVHLTATNRAAPSQVTPSPPAAPSTTTDTAAEGPDTGGPDTGAEATTEPAHEPPLPGGGHADAPGANADLSFDGIE